MITKAQVKHIRSLDDKKIRLETNEFVVEGVKMVNELLQSKISIKHLYSNLVWANEHANYAELITVCTDSELERISFLKTPHSVIAIAALPSYTHEDCAPLALVLDSIQDPGNMGSIIRIADWFGIPSIYVNEACADAYNPKVVQASMGSIFRVNIIQTDLLLLLKENTEKQIFAAILKGKNINHYNKIESGLILLGNESKGIHPDLQQLANQHITIPRIGEAESLNVAVAAGIICNCLLS
jgi:RNA methyltransferase, TrmH family